MASWGMSSPWNKSFKSYRGLSRSHGYLNHSGRSDRSDVSTSSESSTSSSCSNRSKASTSSHDSGIADVTPRRLMTQSSNTSQSSHTSQGSYTSDSGLSASMGRMTLSHSQSTDDLDKVGSSSYPSPRRSSAGLSNMEYHPPDQRDVMKYAHITNEYVRLSEVIDRMHPQQVKEFLKRNLQRKEQKKIIAMSLLFPRQTFPQSQKVHCVRCHKEYEPHEKSSCVIRHPNACVMKTSQDKLGANFRCRSCGSDFRINHMSFYNETVNSHLSGYCYNGAHTSDPREVRYHSAVRTCEESGCVEYYV